LNGVTGRMGANQHLMRSIVEIIKQGGVKLDDGSAIVPDPVLVGRNPDKLAKLAERSGVDNWTTDQEEQRMWEIGLKSDLLDNRLRLNLAYFHNEIDDMQRELNLPDFIDPVGGVVVLQGTVNAGDVTIKGVE